MRVYLRVCTRVMVCVGCVYLCVWWPVCVCVGYECLPLYVCTCVKVCVCTCVCVTMGDKSVSGLGHLPATLLFYPNPGSPAELIPMATVWLPWPAGQGNLVVLAVQGRGGLFPGRGEVVPCSVGSSLLPSLGNTCLERTGTQRGARPTLA